jgi:hypothetical protein
MLFQNPFSFRTRIQKKGQILFSLSDVFEPANFRNTNTKPRGISECRKFLEINIVELLPKLYKCCGLDVDSAGVDLVAINRV